MRNILANVASLMSASFLVHGSNAAITTMIALVVAESGGGQSDVALIAACYSLGFLVGCFLLSNQISRVGLIRAFAAASAVVTVTIIALDLVYGVWLWALLRFTMGAAMAALLAIADTWINDKTPNKQRGSVIAVYATLMSAASLVGQIVFLIFDADADGFVLMFAVSTNIAVVLVAMTASAAPKMHTRPTKFEFNFVVTSKTATVCAFNAGFMTAAVVAVVPFYQTSQGVGENLVAITMISLFLGRLLFMWPAGWLSDRLDRRTVLIGLSAIVAFIALLIWFLAELEGHMIRGDGGMPKQILALLIMLLFGGALYPINSVASSLSFDRAEGKQLVDVSTTNLAVNSLGAIIGPLVVSVLSGIVGLGALFMAIAIAATVNLVVALVRRPLVASPAQNTPSVASATDSSIGMAQAAAEVVEAEMEKADG